MTKNRIAQIATATTTLVVSVANLGVLVNAWTLSAAAIAGIGLVGTNVAVFVGTFFINTTSAP